MYVGQVDAQVGALTIGQRCEKMYDACKHLSTSE